MQCGWGSTKSDRLDLPDDIPQHFYQHHITESVPRRGRFAWGHLSARKHGTAQLVEPVKGRFFDDRFVEGHVTYDLGKIFVVALVEGWPSAFQDVHDSPINGGILN